MNNIHVARYDRGEVRGDAKYTDEGYIRANAVVTRTGVFRYQNTDGTIRRELRHPDDVWHLDSIASMEMIPITNGHPNEKMLNAENSKRLSVGYTGETIKKEGQFILANLVITDADAVDYVRNKNRKELSLGYTVDILDEAGSYNGEEYDARQTNIRYNHLALVDKGRAGSVARISLDSQDAYEITNEDNMAKRKIKIDEEEMIVEASTADHFEKLMEDRRNLEDEVERVTAKLKDDHEELERVKGELERVREELESTQGERDSMRDKMSSSKESDVMSYDSEKFKRAVKERISLFKVAEDLLPKEKVLNMDSMSDLDIKKAIISEKRKSIKLDGKSAIYLDGVFDTILDEREQMRVKTDSVSFGHSNEQLDASDKARLKMIEKQGNAHKGAN